MIKPCEACGMALTSAAVSRDSPGYCRACGDFVYAARPDVEDGAWYFVSETKPRGGEMVFGGQCERCALNQFRIEAESEHTFVGVCAGQDVEGEFKPGCGARHLVRQKRATEVWT